MSENVDLYSDYLLSSFGATTATGLSDLLEGALSHDQITRFLSQQRFDSKTLWQLVKPMVRAIEDDILDSGKTPYDENELISWHFDHSKNRTVKAYQPAQLCLCPRHHPARYLIGSSTAMRKRAGSARAPSKNDWSHRVPTQSVGLPNTCWLTVGFQPKKTALHPRWASISSSP